MDNCSAILLLNICNNGNRKMSTALTYAATTTTTAIKYLNANRKKTTANHPPNAALNGQTLNGSVTLMHMNPCQHRFARTAGIRMYVCV